MLATGRAADALAVPGVAVNSTDLADAGLPESASDALLRRDALSALTDVRTLGERPVDGGIEVTIGFRAGGNDGSSTFTVEEDGWTGILPSWRFAESPLAVIDVTVRGSMAFDVNGFRLDKRQVSPLGVDAPPLDPVALLVFSPGLYRVAVDTAIAETPGADVLADAPLARVPLDLQAEPTEEFVAVVQDRVDSFLDDCATQQVLQPTACPFGFVVQNGNRLQIRPGRQKGALSPWHTLQNAIKRVEKEKRISIADEFVRQALRRPHATRQQFLVDHSPRSPAQPHCNQTSPTAGRGMSLYLRIIWTMR